MPNKNFFNLTKQKIVIQRDYGYSGVHLTIMDESENVLEIVFGLDAAFDLKKILPPTDYEILSEMRRQE